MRELEGLENRKANLRKRIKELKGEIQGIQPKPTRFETFKGKHGLKRYWAEMPKDKKDAWRKRMSDAMKEYHRKRKENIINESLSQTTI